MTEASGCIGNVARDDQRNIARIKDNEEVIITEVLSSKDPTAPCQLDSLYSKGFTPGETQRSCRNCGRFLYRVRSNP